LLASAAASLSAFAHAPVVGHPDPELLFKDSDPKLNANKQVVLHIVRDLLEANHWSDARGTAAMNPFSIIPWCLRV
jgi:hypothetical protein